MGELRDFVFLNDASLNSHLSSLGRGVPSEIVESNEGETEKSGQGGATVFGYGLKGKYAGIDRSAIETTMEITAPYRFQGLLNELNEASIDIYDNPDPRSLSRGDVVRIDATAKPMSLFKFEVTIATIRSLVNSEVQQSFQGAGEDEAVEDWENLDQLGELQGLIKKLIGDRIPIRMETDNWSYGVALDREYMRADPSRVFLDDKDYVLFGRVESRILDGNSWDPVLATSVISRYLSEQDTIEELRTNLEEVADDMNFSMSPDDWEVPGHTATISPIALFW
ncbi:DUF6414 family protein [Halogranum rubrum]|uniref:DUF6414 family protein n=1 Tax=Halogranum rubrum TaxID=553466 RepID=UPI000677B9B4|nr:hypothetical protein [Halogranum salarium]